MLRRVAILALALFFTPVSVWAAACANMCPAQAFQRPAANHCCDRDEESGMPACHRQEKPVKSAPQSHGSVAAQLCQLKPNTAPDSVRLDTPSPVFNWLPLAVFPDSMTGLAAAVPLNPEIRGRTGPQPPDVQLSTIHLTL